MAQVVDELESEVTSCGLDGAGRLESIQQIGGLACTHLPGDAPGHQLAQHRVQSAGGLVPSPTQIVVALGPHPHHRHVIVAADVFEGSGPQGGHRHRAGVVGVVLVGLPAGQQPHPGRQLGRHVHDVLPGGDKLLGQQVTQAARPFDRPRPLPERHRPVEQPLDLASAGPDLHLAERPLNIVDGHRGVRPLVRVDTDHHRHEHLPIATLWKARAGTPDSERSNCRTSFEPRPSENLGESAPR